MFKTWHRIINQTVITIIDNKPSSYIKYFLRQQVYRVSRSRVCCRLPFLPFTLLRFFLCFLNCFTRFLGLLTPPGPHPRHRRTPAGRCLPAASSPSLTFGRTRCVHVACCMLQLPCGLSAGVLPLDRLQLVADTLPVALTLPLSSLSICTAACKNI